MLARILFVSDLHKRHSEAKSVKNQIEQQTLVQEDIINYVHNNGITHIIILGDWYDRGFHGLGQAMSAIEMDRRISQSVNGNVYICLGNHFYLERDENPEMYIIQPCDTVKPVIKMNMPTEPLFHKVDTLRIGDVQFSFFHYSKVNKDYIAEVGEGVKYHVGIYHDDLCVPNWVSDLEGFVHHSSSEYLNKIYDNVDLAIHGHLHATSDIVKAELLNGRTIPLWIPGSLCINQNKPVYKHASVKLPILDVNEDGTVSAHSAEFSTHMDVLAFYESETKKKDMSFTDTADIIKQSTSTQSLHNYLLNKKYSDKYMQIVQTANMGVLDMQTAISILASVNQEELVNE